MQFFIFVFLSVFCLPLFNSATKKNYSYVEKILGGGHPPPPSYAYGVNVLHALLFRCRPIGVAYRLVLSSNINMVSDERRSLPPVQTAVYAMYVHSSHKLR
jgi:hypothetical protein